MLLVIARRLERTQYSTKQEIAIKIYNSPKNIDEKDTLHIVLADVYIVYRYPIYTYNKVIY